MPDWSAIAAWIAAGFAIFSALFAGRSQLKSKELEIVTTHKLDIFEHYIGCAALAIQERCIPEDFKYYRLSVLLYAPRRIHKKILLLNSRLDDGQFQDNDQLLQDIALALTYK